MILCITEASVRRVLVNEAISRAVVACLTEPHDVFAALYEEITLSEDSLVHCENSV